MCEICKKWPVLRRRIKTADLQKTEMSIRNEKIEERDQEPTQLEHITIILLLLTNSSQAEKEMSNGCRNINHNEITTNRWSFYYQVSLASSLRFRDRVYVAEHRGL